MSHIVDKTKLMTVLMSQYKNGLTASLFISTYNHFAFIPLSSEVWFSQDRSSPLI